MYNHAYLDPDLSPRSLQHKVQSDVRFYFARRGAENMDKMTKQSFKLEFHQKTETWYVVKNMDELTKNHKEIDEKVSGFMPENKDDKLCPVRSYKKYIEHLNPANTFLWQTALDNINPKNPDIWYTKQHIGKNTLDHFMTDISDKCKLSKIYTNHSIRVTGATVLTRLSFSSSEIMSITGHKSVQSLTRYQRTQKKQKISMGNVMHQCLTKQEDQIIIPGQKAIENCDQLQQIEYAKVPVSPTVGNTVALYTPAQIQNKENISAEIVPFEPNFDDHDVPDLDLLEILKQVEESNEKNEIPSALITPTAAAMPPTTTAITSNQVLNNIPKSLFHNCNIQNITFNMSK